MTKYILGKIAPIQQGTVAKGDTHWLLNLDMVESNTGRVLDYLYVKPEEIGNSTIMFDTGNVLYSKLRPYLNKVVLPYRDGYATSEMLPLRPDTSIITREYLTCFLRSPHFVRFINGKTSGAKMPRASVTDLMALEIECPTIERQQQITTILEKISSLIVLYNKELQLLDGLTKSQFVEMFGDLCKNTRHWKLIELSAACDVRDGTHESPKYVDSGYYLLTSKNFTSGHLDFTGAKFISEADYIQLSRRSKVDQGDIIMPMIGTIGSPVIVNSSNEFAIKNVALIKFAGSEFSNIFIKAILESDYFFAYISSINRGGTQKFISLGDIRSFPIPDVPLALQNEFAAFVEQLDKSKLAIRKSLEELQLLHDSLMQEYFG